MRITEERKKKKYRAYSFLFFPFLLFEFFYEKNLARRQSKHTLVCLELKPRPWNCYPGGVYGIISLKLSLKPYWRRDARCMSDKKLSGKKKERKKERKKKKR